MRENRASHYNKQVTIPRQMLSTLSQMFFIALLKRYTLDNNTRAQLQLRDHTIRYL